MSMDWEQGQMTGSARGQWYPMPDLDGSDKLRIGHIQTMKLEAIHWSCCWLKWPVLCISKSARRQSKQDSLERGGGPSQGQYCREGRPRSKEVLPNRTRLSIGRSASNMLTKGLADIQRWLVLSCPVPVIPLSTSAAGPR